MKTLNEIIRAVVDLDADGEKIRAYFADGRSAVYSAYMLDLLQTDAATICITSETTGEIIYIESEI